MKPPDMPEPELPDPEIDSPMPEEIPIQEVTPAPIHIETPPLSAINVKGVKVKSTPPQAARGFVKAAIPNALPRPVAKVKPMKRVARPVNKIRFDMGEVDKKPSGISTIQPAYPLRARRRGIEGRVTIKFLVDREGNVHDLAIIDARPANIFEKTIRNTVPKWRFKPAIKDGKKVETAKAMEKAARLKKDPALMFHAAWLWLDADRPKHALPLLEALAKRKKPDVNWLLALCNTYMVLNKELKAAQTMERAVSLDPSAENRYSAGLLWLQVNRHPKALPHLIHLTQMESPKAQWFVALCQARLQAEDMPKAAEAMEQAFAISGKAEHAYQAGIIRLQLKEADKALTLLLPLADRPSPKASWFAAISNAWVQKEVYDKAAAAMEKSAHMTKKSDEYFRAAQLWLQAEAPKNALPLLLAEKPEPKVSWLLTLSGTHQRLDEIPEAAAAMERAAGISKKGEHYYRAAMLWQQADHRENTLKNLRLCVKLTPVEKLKQRWVIELTAMLLEDDLRGEAKAVMEKKSRFMNAALSPDLRYRGALLWLELDQPKRALPILEAICTIRPTSNKVIGKEVQNEKPKYPWLVSLVKTRVELDQYSDAQKSLDHLLNLYPGKSDAWRLAVWLAREQSDFGKAAAAMDVDH